MAEITALDSTFPGTAPQPRVLVVDSNFLYLDTLTTHADAIRAFHHLEPVVRHYNPDSGERGLQAIADYACDPQNHIGMVLVGNRHGERFYGAELARHLTHREPPFAGAVAVQVMGEPDALDRRGVEGCGALGVYNGGAPLTRNYPKADGTLERRANASHPLAVLADAYHHAQGAGSHGRAVMPRLVVIDADANFCKIINHQAQRCQIAYGLKVEALHYDPTGLQPDGYTVEQLVQYIREHPVDMVLSGNSYQQAPYGREIAAELRAGDAPFRGLVAIQTADTPSAEDRKQAWEVGVQHVFSKEEAPLIDGARNELSAFAALAQLYYGRER